MSTIASTTNSASVPAASLHLPDWLAIVRAKVEGLRFGVVQIVVHDALVTQIERTQKTRLSGTGRDE